MLGMAINRIFLKISESNRGGVSGTVIFLSLFHTEMTARIQLIP